MGITAPARGISEMNPRPNPVRPVYGHVANAVSSVMAGDRVPSVLSYSFVCPLLVSVTIK